jgi:hypothetical protein
MGEIDRLESLLAQPGRVPGIDRTTVTRDLGYLRGAVRAYVDVSADYRRPSAQ